MLSQHTHRITYNIVYILGYSVVVPSLPAHGFTDPPQVTGVGPAVIACVYHKLMQKLGYKRFIVSTIVLLYDLCRYVLGAVHLITVIGELKT